MSDPRKLCCFGGEGALRPQLHYDMESSIADSDKPTSRNLTTKSGSRGFFHRDLEVDPSSIGTPLPALDDSTTVPLVYPLMA